MEFCPGGELFDHIVEQGRVKEPEAVRFGAGPADHPLGESGESVRSDRIRMDGQQFTSIHQLFDASLVLKPGGTRVWFIAM